MSSDVSFCVAFAPSSTGNEEERDGEHADGRGEEARDGRPALDAQACELPGGGAHAATAPRAARMPPREVASTARNTR